jgi:signal transduction histidine kinase
MRRAKQFFNFLDAFNIEESDQEKRLEVWHRIEIMAYNLEKVLYVFQDLASRRLALDSVPKEFIDMDKKKSIGSVFSAVENLIAENRLKVDNYTIDIPAELRKLKIDVAHGVLFNKISNILSNVMSGRKDIQSKNIWFNAEISPDEKYLLVNIKDDGKGIPGENLAEPDTTNSEPTNIFQEGFTTKIGGGLGLAFARKQIQSMGGDVIVVSQRVKDQSEKESGGEYAGNGNIHTTFTIKVPLLKQAA